MRIRRISVVNGFDRKEAMQFQVKVSLTGLMTISTTKLGFLLLSKLAKERRRDGFHQLNYHIGDAFKKGIYFDGHQRPDVVGYRKKFLDEMEVYQQRMPTYEGDSMQIQVMPELSSNLRKLIMVVHDECCFQSNDDDLML
jgi:hypothetical protein